MEGVEILFAEETTRLVWNGFVWHWGAAIAVIAGLVLIVFGIRSTVNCTSAEDGFIILIGVIALIAGCVAFYLEGSIPVYDHTKYKVIVDETVDMNEFFEKYELVDQEGKIYIVKDEVPLNEE